MLKHNCIFYNKMKVKNLKKLAFSLTNNKFVFEQNIIKNIYPFYFMKQTNLVVNGQDRTCLLTIIYLYILAL